MSSPVDNCTECRAALLDRAMAGPPVEAVPRALRVHLEECPECRRYAEGLRLAPALFPAAGLYSPGLRRQVLAATAVGTETTGTGRLLLLLGAALTGFGASVVLPLWLLSRLLGTVCPTGICALAGATAIFLLLGIGASGAIAVPALRRNNTGKAAASWAIWR